MDLCTAALRYSFPAQELRLYNGLALGTAAIFGFGGVSERLFAKRDGRYSVAESFLQGTVILALLMYACSLMGFCRPAFYIAAIGSGLLALQVLPRLWGARSRLGRGQVVVACRRQVLAHWREAPWLVAFAGLWYLVLFFAFMFIYLPARQGDLTAIWAYHGKALSCECLLSSHFVTEPYWTGTHPEYPLFLPFLHAFFFNLMDSFRDDIVSLYQSLSLICMAVVLNKTLWQITTSRVATAFALVVYLALLSNHPQSIAFFQYAELNVLVFAGAAACCLLRGDQRRVGLYLIGLSFTKKEGLMAAAVGTGLLACYGCACAVGAPPLRERLRQLRWLLPTAIGIITLAALNRLQPSRHEQYEKVLFEAEAWRKGLATAHEVIGGCWGLLLERKVWWSTILPLPALWIITLALALRTKASLWRQANLLVTWTVLMLGVFIAIYIVSPWGPGLYRITWERLLPPIALPVGLVVAVVLGLVWSRGPLLARIVSLALMAGAAWKVSDAILWEEDVNRRLYGHIAVRHLTGRHAFFAANRGGFEFGSDPERVAALALDDALPPGPMAAALLDDHNFYINYLLYPRRFYAASKDTVAYGIKPFKTWKSLDEVPIKQEGFQYVVKDWQVVNRPL